MIRSHRRKPFTLMPLIALGTLSLMVTVPTLSTMHLHAAPPAHFATVTVQRGDDLWTIAAKHTADGGDVQETLDAIVATNHLGAVTIRPGQALRIPD